MKQDLIEKIKVLLLFGKRNVDGEERDGQVEKILVEELKKDRSKTQIEGFTKLDLMELTRKHICSHKEQK